MEHEVGHGDEDHGLAAFGQGFVVLGQSAVLAQPGEGAFHNPALRQDDKAAGRMSLDDFYDAEEPAPSPMHELPRIPAVGEDHLKPSEACAQLLNQQFCSVAILDVGGMNDQGEDQPKGVDDHMTLAAQRFLARVVPPVPPFSAVLTVWLSRMPTLGVGFLPAFCRTWMRSRS